MYCAPDGPMKAITSCRPSGFWLMAKWKSRRRNISKPDVVRERLESVVAVGHRVLSEFLRREALRLDFALGENLELILKRIQRYSDGPSGRLPCPHDRNPLGSGCADCRCRFHGLPPERSANCAVRSAPLSRSKRLFQCRLATPYC